MAGRFEGLRELEWRVVVDIMPPEPTTRGRGMPQTPVRKVVKTVLSRLSTGCRWGDTPRGPRWASNRAAPRWWQRWQAGGTWAPMPARVLELAQARGMSQWEYGAVDGALSPWEGRG
jgi:transposase